MHIERLIDVKLDFDQPAHIPTLYAKQFFYSLFSTSCNLDVRTLFLFFMLLFLFSLHFFRFQLVHFLFFLPSLRLYPF